MHSFRRGLFRLRFDPNFVPFPSICPVEIRVAYRAVGLGRVSDSENALPKLFSCKNRPFHRYCLRLKSSREGFFRSRPALVASGRSDRSGKSRYSSFFLRRKASRRRPSEVRRSPNTTTNSPNCSPCPSSTTVASGKRSRWCLVGGRSGSCKCPATAGSRRFPAFLTLFCRLRSASAHSRESTFAACSRCSSTAGRRAGRTTSHCFRCLRAMLRCRRVRCPKHCREPCKNSR